MAGAWFRCPNKWRSGFLTAALIMAAGLASRAGGVSADVIYTNVIIPSVPWSIHVVKIARPSSRYEIQARHAGGGALGLSTLRDQIAAVNPALGEPVAAINGGFYKRDTAYAGGARGLQIVSGEVISTPASNACFWIDVGGEPHLDDVVSRFQVIWPDGTATPFGLNEERTDNGVVLYTPAIGQTTHTVGGLELVLERQAGSRWLPLRMGQHYSARVREIRQAGNTTLSPDTMVLCLGPATLRRFQSTGSNTTVQISTASTPSLSVARTALSGGPVLVREGKQQKIRAAAGDAYEFSSMLERHPRSAIGWNKQWYFLVQVDGRQRELSEGMTLEELSGYLVKLGCDEAMNLDGGGSATQWYEGEVRNSPCDGYERTIANSLVVVRKAASTNAAGLTGSKPAQERSAAN
jgi:exopolysaccharide biosynthesis protein